MFKRLDIYLVEAGIINSRTRAQELILDSQIIVNSKIIKKPSYSVSADDIIEQIGPGLKYVSRGGLKLEKALDVFDINLKDKTCLDIGASTGGFTDCMLQNGARKVYAVDVGTNQLAAELKANGRVISLENTNIRYLNFDLLKDKIGFVAVDISFISLTLITDVISQALDNNGTAVLLIKPQFEVGQTNIGKNGVVKGKRLHILAIETVIKSVEKSKLYSYSLDYSPIKGPNGNIEYLLYIGKNDTLRPNISVGEAVNTAHRAL